MAASLQPHLADIRSPFGGEKVYKDECAYSCDTPECETGLYICMKTFLGLGKKHVQRHYERNGGKCAVYLHHQRIKKLLPKKEEEKEGTKPVKNALGVEGGFDLTEPQFEYEEINKVVVLPHWTEVALDDPNLPGEAQISAASIIASDSASKQAELLGLAGTWEGEKLRVSKHADNLVQLENPRKIPPKGWKCEKCDLTKNLWLNLSDGSILCGRKFFDGSGGNNHAVDHYADTKYPLAVKLGTITPNGADVFSYEEDDMVEDPHLAKHLAHFGINITAMEKTDKTMTEMEIDLTSRIGEWDVIQEAGSQLKPAYGPGHTGLHNLGNSCYMNSVLQTLFLMPDFREKYFNKAEEIIARAPNDPTSDFNVQMAKIGYGLLSGDYSKPRPDIPEEQKEPVVVFQQGVRPQMFKLLIGRGHPEFSTKRQQDAQEFLLHLFSHIERNSRGSDNPVDCLKFKVEERIQCTGSGTVKYTYRDDNILALPIPMEATSNKAEVTAFEQKKREYEEQKKFLDPKEIVRPRISLSACLEAFTAEELVDDFFSPALQSKSVAKKSTRLSSFPDYLIIQMKKFTVGDDWVPRKLDVSMDMPDELDLTSLRGQGLQPSEQEMPEAAAPAEPEIQINEAFVAQLVDMGFPVEGCKKAVFHTKNAGIEAAMNWVMEHMGDPDFAEPLQVRGGQGGGGKAFTPNEEALMMIMSMGFTREQAIKALKATDNNIERAADWIFSHAAELDAPMETEPEQPEGQSGADQCRDGAGKYRLVAFISHMGPSTGSGHYVCHVKKNDQWVIFNDEKVAMSEKPPKDLAYIYLYERLSS